MKFKYRYLRDTSGSGRDYIRLPLLKVRLAFGANKTDVVGLVDTGATDCLFDRDVADDLGITLADSDAKREYFGVGGNSLVGHIHPIRFQIQGFSEWIEIEAAFIDSKLPYQILGQSGFFDNYEISFKRFRGRFEIKSRSFLHRNQGHK
ncbi:MAG TPA: aspartyl protease family protein [Pyrinomonadaceae bacterium]|nr:aspartyl protease family protein [Pyrinomonadaceae bacterium]